MLLEVRHRLSFRYDEFVRESRMELHVEPLTNAHQALRAFHLAVGPPAHVGRYRDWNGNTVHHLGVRDWHDRIEVEARSVVDVASEVVGLDALGPGPARADGPLLEFAMPPGPLLGGERLVELEREIEAPADAPLPEQVVAVSKLVRARMKYVPGTTDWESTVEEALEVGSGVCQDFAHVMLGLLRRRGIPSRYVSGYLYVGETDEPTQSHAWVEVHGANGWVGFDPTHDRPPNEQYVTVATGRHYHDVPPNRGIYRGTASEVLDATVDCRPTDLQDVASLRRTTAEFEVPVYTELPTPGRVRAPGAEEQPPAPMEEQQQQ